MKSTYTFPKKSGHVGSTCCRCSSGYRAAVRTSAGVSGARHRSDDGIESEMRPEGAVDDAEGVEKAGAAAMNRRRKLRKLVYASCAKTRCTYRHLDIETGQARGQTRACMFNHQLARVLSVCRTSSNGCLSRSSRLRNSCCECRTSRTSRAR